MLGIIESKLFILLSTKKLIEEAISLPVEERAIIVDSLLRSLNPPNAEIDRKWIEVAEQRLAELRSGQEKAVPGNEVFEKVRKHFSK